MKLSKQKLNFFKGLICFTGGFGFPAPFNTIMWLIAGCFFALGLLPDRPEQ